MAHVIEIWFNPEVERLRQLGLVKEDYRPEKMQVILFPDDNKSVLLDKDVISIEKLKANSNYKDCTHVTFKNVNGNWEGNFDFRHDKGKAQKLFNTALQFFEMAKDAYNAGRLQVFVDNLFSSTELLVQSRLFVMSKQNYVDKPNHKWNMSEFSKLVKLGNMDRRYSKTLGDLSRLRDEARYHKRPFSLEEPEAQEYIMTVEELAEDVRGSIL